MLRNYKQKALCNSIQTNITQIIEQLVSTKTTPVNQINIDYDVSSVEEYKIKSVPTIIILENGKEIKRYIGSITSNQLQNLING